MVKTLLIALAIWGQTDNRFDELDMMALKAKAAEVAKIYKDSDDFLRRLTVKEVVQKWIIDEFPHIRFGLNNNEIQIIVQESEQAARLYDHETPKPQYIPPQISNPRSQPAPSTLGWHAGLIGGQTYWIYGEKKTDSNGEYIKFALDQQIPAVRQAVNLFLQTQVPTLRGNSISLIPK